MNKNSMKEDIERLKLCSANQCNICGRYEKEECMLERNRCEQHILSAYKRVLKELEEKTTILLAGAEKVKQLEKENEELKADNYELNNRITDLLENIPIQKVKDKIEELNSRIEIYREYVEQEIETDVEWVDNVADRETVKVLQKLIEEREEK